MQLDPAQLKATIAKLIADVHAIHRGATANLQLSDLAALLHLPMNDEMQRLLKERGGVSFMPASETGGRFENRGAELKLNTPQATIIFPSLIAGTYTSTAQSLEIHFDPQHTLIGKKMMLSAPVESLTLHPMKLIAKVGGPLGSLLSRTVLVPEGAQ